MRTPRIIIIATFLLTCLILTILSIRSSSPDSNTVQGESIHGVRSFFSFSAPLSLFPPNAIISLTDDNTTSFLARPAAFGPLLPIKGLSGQLWVGSGFGEEALRQGVINAGSEGELGCSDVPGWTDGKKKHTSDGSSGTPFGRHSKSFGAKSKIQKRTNEGTLPVAPVDRSAVVSDGSNEDSVESDVLVDDGTDDYLHSSTQGSTGSTSTNHGKVSNDGSGTFESSHADIQSIQEAAEIEGKIVLLSRGGCGFLEKVKWVQRRGGIALIVGDNTRGGPLIQMYARGDTSNVTIPSVFTSHTTAHLLSSLIPPESTSEDSLDEEGDTSAKGQQTKKTKNAKKKGAKHAVVSKITTTSLASKATATSKSQSSKDRKAGASKEQPAKSRAARPSWLVSLFSKSGRQESAAKSNQPPKNGKLDWVLVDDWDEDEDAAQSSGRSSSAKGPRGAPPQGKTVSDQAPKDGFVIGVQDWRDPDLIDTVKVDDATKTAKPGTKSTPKAKSSSDGKQSVPSSEKKSGAGPSDVAAKKESDITGGSITPGSGQYADGVTPAGSDKKNADNRGTESTISEEEKLGLLTRIFGDDNDESQVSSKEYQSRENKGKINPKSDDDAEDDEDEHEGLWVTLTQTSGASPFFDTLLVLVVSPLVTLTVVYALLLLRSRIRRRRWRAPKSVVERLPVRTYQTVASSTSQSRLPSPTSSSPTTPLLQGGSGARPRPRSRTTSGLPEPGNLSRSNSDTLVPPSRGHEHEKSSSGVASEWKKYMGKQVECVVCLEEYIDGVSRVMSLPCGHEFHVDCITPWLTTRRRTCPICKGDVVRSLARGSSSSTPRYEPYTDDESDEDIQSRAALTVNESPSAALPILSRDGDPDHRDRDGDMEHGIGILSPTPSRPLRGSSHSGSRSGGNQFQLGSWRNLLSPALGGSSNNSRERDRDRRRSRSRTPRPPEVEDRSR